MAKQVGLMYRVGIAQTPAHIAQHVTGDPNRARELIAANPHKPRTGMGGVPTFQTLQEGELLHMPPSWRAKFSHLGLGATGKVLEDGTDVLTDPVLQAAANLDNYLFAKGCDCTSTLVAITTKFQTAYNNGITGGTVSGTRLSTDGKYGPGTRAAMLSLLGHAPNACWGTGNPCSTPQGDIVVPTPPVPTTPDTPGNPNTPGGGGTTPVSVVTGDESSVLPWVIGAAAVAAGIGAMVYLQKQKPAMLARPAARRLPVRRRRISRRRRR